MFRSHFHSGLLLLLLWIFQLFATVYAQEPEDSATDTAMDTANGSSINDDTGILYRNEMTGGILAHTINGFGITWRKGIHITGSRKRIWELELVSLKHPKEYKIFNSCRDRPQGYFYGKINSVLIFRAGAGFQKVIAAKARSITSPVEVRIVYMGGFSAALLKPVYLEIGYGGANCNYDYINTERFDPQIHNTYNIYGDAPFTKGLGEMSAIPGGFLKFALNFEYGAKEKMVKSLEVGTVIDVYSKSVPILANLNPPDGANPNDYYFIALYVEIHLGKKW